MGVKRGAVIAGRRVRAVIFDFDGVLADTEAAHCTALQSVAAAAGMALSRDMYFRYLLGLPDRACLAAVCEQAGQRADAARLDALVANKRAEFARLSRATGLYPGVAAAVRGIHRHCMLAIASGAFREEIEPVLEREGVRSLFSAVVGADDVHVGKPAPAPFLAALHELNRTCDAALAAADCLAVEDAPAGIVAAHAAGMRCVGVTTHYDRAGLAGAEAIIGRVSDLQVEDLRP
ncbi:MAG: HAD family hydrolase [Candidatus Binatia bacterium]